MGVRPQDQVELFELLFGASWEDPQSDRRALRIRPGDRVITVTSGGCNTLTLLLEDPAQIHALDINPLQSYLLELKCAAIRRLEYDELHAFLGIDPSDTRLEVFERLAEDLTESAARYWRSRPNALAHGIVNAGNYESFIRLFSGFLGVFQGKKRIQGLLRCETLQQQREYFDTRWNTLRWRLLFRLLANKWVLARRGLTVDYFKFDDGSASFPESFLRRTRHAMCEIPIQSNYFIAQYLLARYTGKTALPAYLLKQNLPLVKERLGRIEIVTEPAQNWLSRQPADSIQCFSLSNICELMSLDETSRLFGEVSRSGVDGGRICFRNLIVPRAVPEHLREQLQLQEELSRELLARDRSFVYSRVQAFIIRKDAPA
jgi:S-adenosylmethionine-diacylglycerol 3-amino-3-carboxypropyl transferase